MPFSHEQDNPALHEPADPAGVETSPDAPTPVASIADGRQRQLDPRSIRVNQISGGILAAFLCGAMLVAVIAAGIVGPFGLFGGLLLLGGWLLASALLTGLLVAWPPLSYRHTFYEVTDQGIRIRRGVLWRNVTSVPRSRIQHTDVSQGPIERAFELATLVIYTAGTHHASISLSGLARETALLIRDHLIVSGEGDAV
jgi:membrane protein YdbS with pleckstrin-like domain